MSLSLLPKSLNNTINSTLAKYWWGQIKNERKIHWIHWKKLCYPKNMGGMGFGKFMFSISLCQLNRHGEYYTIQLRFFIGCMRLVISQDVHSWKLSWATIHPSYGKVCWQQGSFYELGQGVRQGMVDQQLFKI